MVKIRLAVGLILLLSLLGPSTPATADSDEVKWSEVNLPTEGEAGSWMLADGADVQHLTMAIDGTLYGYANPSGTSYTLFKSEDGGYSWSYTGKVEDAIVDIATVPDDASIVYYATVSDVYKSTDAGSSFSKLVPNPGGAGSDNLTITSIDVAWLGEDSIIAVGVRDNDSSEYGGVYTLDEGKLVPGWVDTNVGGYDVYAVAFSPNYAGDWQLVAVVTDETDTLVTTKVGDAGWGATVGDARIGRLVPGRLVPASACIAFPDDYDATDEYVLFVAIDGSDNGDVYRVDSVAAPDGSEATDLNIGSRYRLSDVDVTSLAISGEAASADILAGAASSAQVYYSSDGGESWRRSSKEPTGQSETHVVMAPGFGSSGIAYAATSGSGSAFSITQDGGNTWNQVGLIDTNIARIVDRISSPNYIRDNTLFMLTRDKKDSLWRSLDGGARWERVFSSALPNVGRVRLVELSPKYGDGSQVVFLAGTGNGDPAIWKSTDNGQNFIYRITRDPVTGDTFSINTWAVVNDDTLFIGSYDDDEDNGLVYYTTDSGWTYSTGTIVGKHSLSSIVLSPDYEEDKTILVGNTKGWVYWSEDNGVSFKPLPPKAVLPPFTRSVTIDFDPEFSSNRTVYAVTLTADVYDIHKGLYKGIYRFVIGESTKWVYLLPTSAPTLVGPEPDFSVNYNPITGRASRVTFTWEQPSEEVTKYDLWLAFDDDFDEVVEKISVEETGTMVSVVVGPEADMQLEFVPGTTYFWKVRTYSDYPFECQWSETRQFTVEGAVIPAADITVEAPPPSKVTVEFPPSEVTIQIPPAPAPVIPPAEEVPAHLLWTLIGAGAALVIALAVATRLSYAVSAPRLLSPEAGAGGVPLKPLFQWSAVPGADSYELLVSTNPSLADPAVIKTGAYALAGTAWRCTVRLNWETAYYWKVRAISSATWSAVGAFTTKPPPSSPPPGHRPSRPFS